MTVTASPSFVGYTGNGVTTVFAYPFRILAAAHLRVTVDGVVASAYTVSGVGAGGGGNITFSAAPANGAKLVLQRAMPYTRETDYQATGDLPADVLNADQDAPVMMLQQLADADDRSIRVPVGETLAELPAAADRANKFLKFDDLGRPVLDQSESITASQLLSEVVDLSTFWPPGSVGSKLALVVSVKDYPFSAAGNGSTDDTEAINSAFAAVNAGTVKNLHFPAGTYVVSGALTTITRSGVSITGDGKRASVIWQTANTNTLSFASTSPATTALGDIEIRGVGIDQQGASNPSAGIALRLTRLNRGYFDIDVRNAFAGILVEGCAELHFKSLTVTGAYSWTGLAAGSYLMRLAYHSASGSTNGEIFINGCNLKGAGAFGGPLRLNSGVLIEAVDGLFVSNGHIGFSHNASLYINPQNIAGASVQNVEFDQVYFDGNGGGSTSTSLVLISGSATPVVERIKFTGCSFKNFDGNAFDANLSTLRDLTIQGSEFKDCGGFGVILTGVQKFSLADNVFDGLNMGGAGTSAIALVGCSSGTISDNRVLAGSTAHASGINVNAACTDLLITDNVFSGHTLNLAIAAGAARVQLSPSGAVSVKDWGAKGDGTTPDHTAIQAAIDYCYAKGGGVVHLPVGRYVLGATLTIPQRVVLQGETASFVNQFVDTHAAGAGSVLQAVAGLNSDVVQVQCRLYVDAGVLRETTLGGRNADARHGGGMRNITVWGNRSAAVAPTAVDLNNAGHGVHVRGARYVTLENVITMFCGDDGIRTGSLDYGLGAVFVNNARIVNCSSLSNNANGMYLNVGDSFVESPNCGYNGAYGIVELMGNSVINGGLSWNNVSGGVYSGTNNETSVSKIFGMHSYDNDGIGFRQESTGGLLTLSALINCTARGNGRDAGLPAWARSNFFISSNATNWNWSGCIASAYDQTGAATSTHGFYVSTTQPGMFGADNISRAATVSDYYFGDPAALGFSLNGRLIHSASGLRFNSWNTISSITSNTLAAGGSNSLVSLNCTGAQTINDITFTGSGIPFVIVRNISTDTVTFTHNVTKLRCANGADVVLAQHEATMFVWVSGTVWQQVGGAA